MASLPVKSRLLLLGRLGWRTRTQLLHPCVEWNRVDGNFLQESHRWCPHNPSSSSSSIVSGANSLSQFRDCLRDAHSGPAPTARAPDVRDWGNRHSTQCLPTNRGGFRQSMHALKLLNAEAGGLLAWRRHISSHGQTKPISQGNAAQFSLADEVENDMFLKEARAVAADSAESETETGTDSEEPDDVRLERAERDYIEALGNGDMVDLDLEQLDSILEAGPTDDSYTVGSLYIKLGQEYDSNGESADQILRCGEKALRIFQTKTNDVRLEIAMALHLIAIAHVRSEKYEQSIPIMHEAIEIFEKKGGEQSRVAVCAVRFLLGEALSNLGRSDEALNYLRPAVTEQELLLGKAHPQLGRSYRNIAKVLTNVMKYEEALRFAEKALKVNLKVSGEGSMEEAIDRRLLAVIHVGLDDHESALAEHMMVRKILSTKGHGSQTVFVDISTANAEITLGKYAEAISSLETALSKVEEGSAMHALVLVNLAKVYERQKKTQEANKYAKEVLRILENKVLTTTDPLAVAEGYTELAALYEKINQVEEAIELLRKAHAIYAPIPDQKNAVAGTQAQIGMLLLFTGKIEEAVPFLESAVHNMEVAAGENYAIAMVLNHLGVAYVELEKLEEAAAHFERAKGIFDEVLGTDHDHTIAVARNLVNAYSLLDRLDDAIMYQKEVIAELEKRGDDELKEMLEDAVRHLEVLQEQSENANLDCQT